MVSELFMIRRQQQPVCTAELSIAWITESMCIHLDGTKRAQVGLEDILETLSRTDVDLQSFTPPL